MKIKFLGHSSLLIEQGNTKALIDPFLSQNPQYKENIEDITGITHIFLTHAHADHIGDAMDIAKANNSLVITNAELCGILHRRNNDVDFHRMHIGGTFNFDFGRVRMTPALHGSGYTDENGIVQAGGNPAGFVIEMDGKKLYHSGDTGLTYDMKLLEREHIDIAFLPIGGNYTMDIDDAVEATRFVNPKIVVPMHYNTFGQIKADPYEFKKKLLGHEVIILSPSETITL